VVPGHDAARRGAIEARRRACALVERLLEPSAAAVLAMLVLGC
jgi:hypothetical protein